MAEREGTVAARFRAASRATGTRRQVFVHVYNDQTELSRAHCAALGMPFDADVGGGVTYQGGFHWPRPAAKPLVVMRLWTGQLTARTIAHEATHAASLFFFLDSVPGWDTRARTVLLGDHEPLAHLVGDFTASITDNLYRLGLIVNAEEANRG